MDVIDFYTDSWISDDQDGVRRVLAPDAEIDWNLDAPVDEVELVLTLHRIAAFADSVTVVSRVHGTDGAALVYDLVAPFGTARFAEFLSVRDGRITEVRQVYDIVAIDRYFPGLKEQ
jgi:ketosteroid isomerase-like protein